MAGEISALGAFVHFGLSEEQAMLKEAVQGFLGELPSARDVLEGASPRDPGTWTRVVQEQGWQAIVIPEDLGGLGMGWMDLAVVFEELGRTLAPTSMLETAMATAALLQASPTPDRDAALSQLAGGMPGALGLETSIVALEMGDGWLLNGTAQAVVGGEQAQVLVLETNGGFFLVPPAESERLSQETLDVTRPVAAVSVNGLTLQPGFRLEGATPGAVHARCETLVAAEAVGAAEACLDLSVEYAKTRHQFDKPIGSFQAIQHKCADMMVGVESARSATWYAAWALDSQAEDARLAARTAKALATDTLSRCAGESIQIHGGIGFTWEHDAHLYFKRARGSLELLGTPRTHRAAVAEHLLGAL